MFVQRSGSSLLQDRNLSAQAFAGQLRQCRRIEFPAHMARSISRPETPITSDITLLSFMLASSNTFRIRFPIRTCSCFSVVRLRVRSRNS